MNTLLAAFFSIAVGALFAWALYGLNSDKPVPWGLAFLRFFWVSFLAYAILAPPISEREQVAWAPTVLVAVDTSASVKGDAWGAAERVQAQLEEQGWRALVEPFDPMSGSGDGPPWLYVGDGRIETTSSTPPMGALFVEGHPLEPAPLIQGLVAPERVLVGSSFEVVVLTNETAEIVLTSSNGARVKGTANEPIVLQAPNEAGVFRTTVAATAVGTNRADRQEWTAEAVFSAQEVAVVYLRPHEHVGMAVRAIKALGYQPKVSSWRAWDSSVGNGAPVVLVGGDASHLEQLKERNAATLWLTAVHPKAQWKRRPVEVGGRFPSWTGAKKVKLAVLERGERNPQEWPEPVLTNEEALVDARGVAFWPSAVNDPTSLDLLQHLVEVVVQKSTPLRLKVSVPSRLFQGQQVRGAAYLIDANGSVAPNFEYSVALFNQGALIARPPVQSQGGGAAFTLANLKPGPAQLQVTATGPGQQWERTVSFEVSATSVEQLRPFNDNLWSAWERAGTVVFPEGAALSKVDSWQASPRTLDYLKEKPQHHRWWYWGLWMLAAAVEWTLRRLRGLR